MDRMLYVGMNGAKHSMHSLNSTTNNLANVSTTGFREDLAQFRSMPVFGPGHDTRAYAQTERPGYNFEPGPLQTTGRDLDVAIQGEGWFSVQGDDGTEAYTRRGDLDVNPNGLLVNGAGDLVMGENGPIAIPPNTKVEIGTDGTVGIQPPGGQAGEMVPVDRLRLVNPPMNQMEKGEDGLFRMANGEPAPMDGNVRVVGGAVEGSNVNAVESLTRMIELQRGYERQVKIMKAADENAQQTTQVMRVN
ncbi:MAG: flagellar basal-body rod protein FlgF [Pseudomonadota bacterium]